MITTASIMAAIATSGALGIVCAFMLRFAERRNRQLAEKIVLVALIDDLLPQTQCGECGHMGCRPYAAAIVEGEAINRCPPGGEMTIAALATLLDKPIVPLDGVTKPDRIAFIREDECIGCTKCIQACPVDAIAGAAKLMHTVIADECTGCDLCVEPCPVDCIEMRPTERITQPAHYRHRYVAHNARLEREAHERELKRVERAHRIEKKTQAQVAVEKTGAASSTTCAGKTKQDEIREAIARTKIRKAAAQTQPPFDARNNDSSK